MSVPFLPSIDIVNYAAEEAGLSLKALSYFSNVHAELNQENIDHAPSYLRETAGLYETYFDVTAVESLDDIISLLDSGAAKVFVTLKQLEGLRKAGIEASRIVKSVEAKCAASAQNSCAIANHALHLQCATDVNPIITAISKNREAPLETGHGDNVYVTLETTDEASALKLAKVGAIPIIPARLLTLDKNEHPNLIGATSLLLTNARSDREDGLFSTIVTDERGTALGLVYSSKESIVESLRTGRGVYQSRKRGLWRKGETSGDIQELVSIRFDCDMDALCFMVKQKGRGFCHLASATCFGNYHGLSKLQQTLKSRKKSSPEGSYTARLFNEPELLNAKIREEASELCEASTKEEISWEAADLIFFALTKCIAAGVTLEDVELNLDVKSVKVKRRAGDAKTPYLGKDGAGAQFALGASHVDTTRANVALQSKAEAADAQPNGLRKHPPDIKVIPDGVAQVKEENIPAIDSQMLANGTRELDSKTGGSGRLITMKKESQVKIASSEGSGNTTKDISNKEGEIKMKRYVTSEVSSDQIDAALQRPSQRSSEKTMAIIAPIVKDIREQGDRALLGYTHKFEKATSLTSAVLKAPFASELMQISQETKDAIDVSYENIRKFHAAQKESKPLSVETMPGVECSRFSRPIARVGLYIPGGTAVLPSSAMMLGVPAVVAGCKTIVLATPPRADGTITPEIVYIAHKIGAESIVLAGGAQAVAAMAYGTESVSKVDKILGPGNQFVTAAKMLVSNDTTARVAIDMPAGPSEVLVVADSTSNPVFVAADLLSQAEHGADSQVVLITVDMAEDQLAAIEAELQRQALALPRVDVVRPAIAHSVTLCARSIDEAMALSNAYAPEHLILQVRDAEAASTLVENAGSVFIGPWTPESVGDYSAGVNHSLPTYGYARMYSGVNLASYVKHITSTRCSAEGLKALAPSVMQLAHIEELEAHRNAVDVRMSAMR